MLWMCKLHSFSFQLCSSICLYTTLGGYTIFDRYVFHIDLFIIHITDIHATCLLLLINTEILTASRLGLLKVLIFLTFYTKSIAVKRNSRVN